MLNESYILIAECIDRCYAVIIIIKKFHRFCMLKLIYY